MGGALPGAPRAKRPGLNVDPSTTSPFPDSIGPYIPLRLLGRGGWAEVYLCVDQRGLEVAVKWLSHSSGRAAKRFKLEIEALQTVRHPRVIRYLDQGTHLGRPYLVMDYVEGQDLVMYGDKLQLRPAAERYRETRRIGMELCEALNAMHAAGFVHRDVKPSNALQDDTGRTVLSDLGVVLDVRGNGQTTGSLVGTVAYGAPEQLMGHAIDHRADLYALGCTLYVLLTGRRPFAQKTREALLHAHCNDAPLAPSTLDPSVPPGLEAAILKLMAKDARDRPANALAARAQLDASGLHAAPAPLAGRQRFVRAVGLSLDRVQAGEGRVLRAQGPAGSGRRWLLDVIEDLATRRGVPFLIARDKPTLTQGLRRLREGEALLLGTRLRVPPNVPVDTVVLEPLGPADLRRTVVSVAPDTPEPHLVADALFRATGGHPAWLLAVLEAHTRDGVVELPDPIPPPEHVLECIDELPMEASETLAALALLQLRATPDLLEQVTMVPADEPLAVLEEQGMVVQHGGRYTVMGQIVGDAAMAEIPDPVAVHRRAADALESVGEAGRAQRHRIAAGDADGDLPPLDPLTTMVLSLPAIRDAHLRGNLAEAWDEINQLLAAARARRDRAMELDVLFQMGVQLMDLGDPVRAQSRLADAVALARALKRPHVRRRAHLLRALATLDRRPGNRVATSAALDRVQRALSRVGVPPTPQETALASAVQARAHAAVQHEHGWDKAVARAVALTDLSDPEDRLRVQLELARAARAMGRLDESQARADQVSIEAGSLGWKTLAWHARREVARSLGTRPPEPRDLARGLSDEARELLSKHL